MKIILFISFFLFSYSECFGEWKFVYWSELVNFNKHISGIMSMSVNMMGNCEKLHQKSIKFEYFSEHFGDEFVKSSFNNGKKWVILDAKSVQYQILKKICKS